MDALDKVVSSEVVDLLFFLAELIDRTSNAEAVKDFNTGLRQLVNLIDEKNGIPMTRPDKNYYDFIRTKLIDFRNSNPGRSPMEYMKMAMEAEMGRK
jgi:hypothetical protein